MYWERKEFRLVGGKAVGEEERMRLKEAEEKAEADRLAEVSGEMDDETDGLNG